MHSCILELVCTRAEAGRDYGAKPWPSDVAAACCVHERKPKGSGALDLAEARMTTECYSLEPSSSVHSAWIYCHATQNQPQSLLLTTHLVQHPHKSCYRKTKPLWFNAQNACTAPCCSEQISLPYLCLIISTFRVTFRARIAESSALHRWPHSDLSCSFAPAEQINWSSRSPMHCVELTSVQWEWMV